MKGIEPSSTAWEAVALPLSYIRMAALYQEDPFFDNTRHVCVWT